VNPRRRLVALALAALVSAVSPAAAQDAGVGAPARPGIRQPGRQVPGGQAPRGPAFEGRNPARRPAAEAPAAEAPAPNAADGADAPDPSSPEASDAAQRAAPSDATRREVLRLTRQAMRLIAQKKWGEAEAVLEDALALAPGNPVNLYNLACVRARLGRPDPAMESLEHAAEAGFTDFALIERDPDLEPLRGLPRFKSLLAKKDDWQRRAAEAVVEVLRHRFGEDYLYAVDADQKLIFATNVDAQTLEDLKVALKAQARSEEKELFPHKPDAFVTIVVPSADDYRRLMRLRNVPGVYIDASKTLIAQKLGGVVRHEFTHALHAGDRAPLGQDHAPWVAEGLGVLYEWADVSPEAVVPRGDNPRFAVAQFAARRRSLIPLDRLVNMAQAEFMSRPNLTYPESGALLFYLRERGVLRKFYDEYKATFDADTTGAKALERASGQTLGELESAWKQWLLERGEGDPRRGYTPFLDASLTRKDEGMTVTAVRQGGVGDFAGLKPGDVLVSINGRAVADYAAIRPAVGSFAPGKNVALKVRRDGKELDLSLKMARPAAPVAR
jgi:hypothetical protein